ncbi:MULTISPECIES: DMT family transporter [Pseudomonas]|uniref:DMT family transporter n=1 Tax=Pseudomonas TaxID=286 RepID=UPI000CD043B5|nr:MULTISPECIES: DMT family transporter [unclassified Pseudomonas]POA59692.1 EamA family transporter [Pseudomonas sp. FW507-12TSA]
MAVRQPLDATACSLMVGLCAVWGLQQVALKATVQDIAPIMQIALRSAGAALLVGLLMLWRGERLGLREGHWRPGLVVGALFALEFLLVGEGLRHTSASHMAIFLYTAPIFAALGLHWRLPAERLKSMQWLGIGVAFAGIVVAFSGPSSQGAGGNALLGDFLGLLGGAAWGATTVVVRCSRLASSPTTRTLQYQLLGACVWLGLAAWLSGQTSIRFTPLVITSLGFQVLVVSFASFLIWFGLLRRYLASRLGVLSFMTPLFGIGFGVWLLHEPLEPRFIFGAALVLAGIVLVSGYEWLRQRLGHGPRRALDS